MLTRIQACRWLLSVLAGFFAGGCAPNSHSLPLRVAIRTIEDTVILRRSPQLTSFSVTAIARNVDSRPLQVTLCRIDAQRDIAGTWTTVFTPFCASSGEATLFPGDSVVVPVEVFGYTGLNRVPALDPRMIAGRYRLFFGVGLFDPTAPTASSAVQGEGSTPFIVK